MRRVRELDGLRGIAILLVVVGHWIHHPSLILWGPHWGWFGVNLFLVLSGFLITTILLRSTESRGALRTFYARRALRIFPLYYGVLLVYFLAAIWMRTPQPWQTVGTYLFFLQGIVPPQITHLHIIPRPDWTIMGFSVLWTLSAEEAFYLLWAPLVLWTRANRRVLTPMLGLILLADPALRFFYPHPHWIQETFWGQMDSLAAGSLLALLWMDHNAMLMAWAGRCRLRIHVGWAALLAAAIGLDVATGLAYKAPLALRVFNAAEYSLLWAAWSLLLLLTLTAAGGPSQLARVLRAQWLVGLGLVSYCLYLVHYPVHLFWRARLPHSLSLAVELVTALAISALSWRYLEQPLAAWKQKRYPMEKSIVTAGKP